VKKWRQAYGKDELERMIAQTDEFGFTASDYANDKTYFGGNRWYSPYYSGKKRNSKRGGRKLNDLCKEFIGGGWRARNFLIQRPPKPG